MKRKTVKNIKRVGRKYVNLYSNGEMYTVFKVYILDMEGDNSLQRKPDKLEVFPYGTELELFPSGTTLDEVFGQAWPKKSVEMMPFFSTDIVKLPEV